MAQSVMMSALVNVKTAVQGVTMRQIIIQTARLAPRVGGPTKKAQLSANIVTGGGTEIKRGPTVVRIVAGGGTLIRRGK